MVKGYADCPYCGEMYSCRAMPNHKAVCPKRPSTEYERNKLLTKEIIDNGTKPDIDELIKQNMNEEQKEKRYTNPLLENGIKVKTTTNSGKHHKSKAIFDSFFQKIRWWVDKSYLKINLYTLFETVEPQFSFEDNCLVIRYKLVK